VWTPEAEQSLAQLKDFLSKPPILTAPRKKEQLLADREGVSYSPSVIGVTLNIYQ
jgi:hypothetical protein